MLKAKALAFTATISWAAVLPPNSWIAAYGTPVLDIETDVSDPSFSIEEMIEDNRKITNALREPFLNWKK
jgi:hypothetical protein